MASARDFHCHCDGHAYPLQPAESRDALRRSENGSSSSIMNSWDGSSTELQAGMCRGVSLNFFPLTFRAFVLEAVEW
jgi:hypothetical protein